MDRCWICGKQARDDSVSCGRLACLMELDELHADEINTDERAIRVGMWNSMFAFMSTRRSFAERWFYTVKLWICGMFGWRGHFDYRTDPVDVAEVCFCRTYGGWDQTWLRVGSGVFTNWQYELMNDSEWNM